MCYVIDFACKVQTESSMCLEVLIKMSPLGLYYDTVDIIDDFLDSIKHLCGKVCIRTTVSKKRVWMCCCNSHKEQSRRVYALHNSSSRKKLTKYGFLQSVLYHIESLCMELYQITDINSDADVESKME